MKTQQIASFLGVQHELVRDAAGELFSRCSGVFSESEQAAIRAKIAQWERLKNNY